MLTRRRQKAHRNISYSKNMHHAAAQSTDKEGSESQLVNLHSFG